MMTRKERKAERWRLYRQFFRLIDSYDDANIDLAIAMMAGNRGLRDVAKNRYYPIIWLLDSSMGGSWGTLRRVRELVTSGQAQGRPLADFLVKFVQHYKGLGELAVVEDIVSVGVEQAFRRITSRRDVERLGEFEAPIPVRYINIQDGRGGKLGIAARHLRELETLHLNGGTDILEAVLAAAPQNLLIVDMMHCELEVFPTALADLPKLEHLRLHGHAMTKIADCFRADMPLRSLSLEYLPIKFLPESICKLEHLERLSLRNCQLNNVPRGCRDMPKLRFVGMSRRQIGKRQVAELEALRANLPLDCEISIY